MVYWNTVTGRLKVTLTQLMENPLFDPFRLVGGTALSLQRGHRISVDIDLFTDAHYDSIDFKEIDAYLRRTYEYVSPAVLPDVLAMGQSYIMGESEEDAIKLDLYYADTFQWDPVVVKGIRMASIEEIAAMKIDIVQRGGRKKDFWDLHELGDSFNIDELIAFHKTRYPYDHDEGLIKRNLIDFSTADDDFDPECLKGKHWEIIKLDFVELLEKA